MADTNLEFEALRAQRSNGQPDQSEATRLASLRTLAQQHLEEISQMTRDERLQEEKRMEELEAEMRRRKHQKPSKPSDNQDGGDAKESRMRSAQGKSPFNLSSKTCAKHDACLMRCRGSRSLARGSFPQNR